jgi:hypothetical protein
MDISTEAGKTKGVAALGKAPQHGLEQARREEKKFLKGFAG